MSAEQPIAFPELPRSELERSIEDLVERAKDVLATQSRLRNLLAATRSIAEDLDLDTVLRRIAEAAVELVGARYGALGVIGSDGMLERFIHVGLSDEVAHRIGHPPRGRGVLGAVIADPRPIRLEHLGEDPRSDGFPPNHPPMDSFVGVPIRVRGEVFGNLYLTNREGGPFTGEDEELLTALAAAAGVAVENARLFGEARSREEWALTAAEVTAALLSEEALDPVGLVADAVLRLSGGSAAVLVSPTESGALAVERSWGEEGAVFDGRVFPMEAAFSGPVVLTGNPAVSAGVPVPDAAEGAFTGPAMALPLPRSDGSSRALVVLRSPGARGFSEGDLDPASEFIVNAGVALELREARRAQERVVLLEDRSRIARDLHDNVIQKLFAAGLSLNAVDHQGLSPALGGTVESVSALLDDAIAEIRKSVFALRTSDARGRNVRHVLLDVVGESAGAFPVAPRIAFDGDLDAVNATGMLEDVEAVVREGLANAVRHSGAERVEVVVAATQDSIEVTVTDDGRGPGEPTRSSGTANLAARAEARGGSSRLSPGPDGGAVLTWSVPAPLADGGAT